MSDGAPHDEVARPDEATETGEVAAAPTRDIRKVFPLIGLGIAVWASLPMYSGPELTVRGGTATEFADHIVPAVVIAGASLVALLYWRRPTGPGLAAFFCGALVLLCGFWMLATHWQLLLQATRDEAPWPGAIYHNASAIAVFGFGLLWTVSHWADLSDAMEEDDKKRAAAGEPGS